MRLGYLGVCHDSSPSKCDQFDFCTCCLYNKDFIGPILLFMAPVTPAKNVHPETDFHIYITHVNTSIKQDCLLLLQNYDLPKQNCNIWRGGGCGNSS